MVPSSDFLGCYAPGVRAALLVAVLFLGHRFEHPKILRLGIQDGRIVLAVTYDVNPGREASRTRALFDRDTNGVLDEPERATLERYLVKTASMWLRLEVGGEVISTDTATVARRRFDRPSADSSTLGISMLVTAPAPGASLSVALVDRDRDKRKHVPVTVDVVGPYRVRLSSQGEWDPKARQIRGIRLEDGLGLELRLTRQP